MVAGGHLTVSGASARSALFARGRGHGGAEDSVSGSSVRRPRPCRCRGAPLRAERGAVRLRAIGAALPRTRRSEARGPGRGAALAARRIYLSPFSFRWFEEGSSCAFYRFFSTSPFSLPCSFPSSLLSPFAPVQPCRAPPAAVGGPVRCSPRTARPARGRRRRRRLCSARRAGAGAKPGSARPRPAARGPPGGSGREGGVGGRAAPPPGAPCERGARRGGRGGFPRPVGGCGAGPTGGAAADLAPALPRAAALCPPLGLTRSPGSILARAAVHCLPGSAPALRCPRPRAASRARRGPDLLTAAPGKVAAFSE